MNDEELFSESLDFIKIDFSTFAVQSASLDIAPLVHSKKILEPS